MQEFLERDENSAMAPRIEDCVRRKKVYYRKRYLLYTIDNLHKKYKLNEPVKIGRSLFYRLKPFWIVKKQESARDTCLCKTHANFDLMHKKLIALKLLPSESAFDFIKKLVCDPSNQNCMYKLCDTCKNRSIEIPGTWEIIVSG